MFCRVLSISYGFILLKGTPCNMYLFVAMQMIHILSVVVGVSTLGGVSKPPWCRISRILLFARPSWLWKAWICSMPSNPWSMNEVDLAHHTATDKTWQNAFKIEQIKVKACRSTSKHWHAAGTSSLNRAPAGAEIESSAKRPGISSPFDLGIKILDWSVQRYEYDLAT
jgi:hypothetical protein